MKRIILLTFFLLSTVIGFAQQESAEVKLKSTGIWAGLYLKVRFSNKLGYYGEHHYRGQNKIDDVNSFVGRPSKLYNRFGLNYYVNKNFEIVVGPALIYRFDPTTDDPTTEPTLEPRIWTQFLFKSKPIGRVKLVHQFRFEQRWKRSNEIGSDYKFTNRYRYKFFAYIPLGASRQIKAKTWFFSPSAEIFMQSGKSIVYNPFEDFRTYNGFGYVVNNNLTFFAGHMWTIGQESTGYQYGTSHVFRFNVYIGIDARKTSDKLPKINLGY